MLAVVAPRRRRVLGLVAVAGATALALSGCAAGQDAQTVEQTSVVDGTAFQAGAVKLRDFGVVAPTGPSYAAGANVFLEGLIVNTAASTDRLVSVSSPLATKVEFYGDGTSATAAATATPSATASATSSATAGATSSATSSATGSATSSATGSATATGSTSSSPASQGATPLTEFSLPTNKSVQFGYDSQQPAIVLLGLTKQLFPSQAVPITFTFADGGTVTATISVKLPVGGSLDAPTVDTHPTE